MVYFSTFIPSKYTRNTTKIEVLFNWSECFCDIIITYLLYIDTLECNYIIFRVASFAWSGLTAIITILITIYAIISGKVLYETTKKSVAKQSFADKEWNVVRRLIVVNSFITLYFIFATTVHIYYAIYIQNTDDIIPHKIMELIANAVCLLIICWMYRSSMQRLIKSDKLDAEQRKIRYLRKKSTAIAISHATKSTKPRGLPFPESPTSKSPKSPKSSESPDIDSAIITSTSPRMPVHTTRASRVNMNDLGVIEEENDSMAIEVKNNENQSKIIYKAPQESDFDEKPKLTFVCTESAGTAYSEYYGGTRTRQSSVDSIYINGNVAVTRKSSIESNQSCEESNCTNITNIMMPPTRNSAIITSLPIAESPNTAESVQQSSLVGGDEKRGSRCTCE